MNFKLFLLLVMFHNSLFADEATKGKILYFLDHDKKEYALINLGKEDGLSNNSVIYTQRHNYETDLKVTTGVLKIQSLDSHTAIARIIEKETLDSKAIWPEFSFVMVGDMISVPKFVLSATEQLLPELSFQFYELFIDPNQNPKTFELSDQGKEKLEAVLELLGDKKFSTLLVKGYTDPKGTKEENQIESYQRSLAVRQYLVDQLGFNDKKTLAIGMGETELLDKSMVSGSHLANRRIIIKTGL